MHLARIHPGVAARVEPTMCGGEDVTWPDQRAGAIAPVRWTQDDAHPGERGQRPPVRRQRQAMICRPNTAWGGASRAPAAPAVQVRSEPAAVPSAHAL